MSVKKFKFVSPGIFINEIDNSQLTKVGSDIGPVIIGRTLRGPAMRPVEIQSFADFIETFGEPVAGGVGGDVWRDGNRLGPTYAAYAAQAYLRNASPITFVRLLGEDHEDSGSTAQKAGWQFKTDGTDAWTPASGGAGGAYGLFIANGGGAAVAAYRDFTVSGIEEGDAGMTIQFDMDTDGVENTLTESTGKHRAYRFDVAAVPGGNETITFTRHGGQVVTLVIGDVAGAGSAPVTIDCNGMNERALADAIIAHFNDAADVDGLQAVHDSGAGVGGLATDDHVIIIRETVREKAGAAGSAVAATFSGASFDTPTIGWVDAFSAYTSASVPFDRNDYVTPGSAPSSESGAAVISIGAACDTAGLHPRTVAAGSSNAAVDEALVAQIVSKTVTNFDLAVDSTSKNVYRVTAKVAGVNADDRITHSSARITPTGAQLLANGSNADMVMDGALAAIIYVKEGGVTLTGIQANSDSRYADAVGVWVKSDGSNNQFKLRVRNPDGLAGLTSTTNTEDIAFNFNRNSRNYIRKVLNTNPTLTNDQICESSKLKAYFLGQTFDRHLADVQENYLAAVAAGGKGGELGAGKQFACLVPLKSASNNLSGMLPAQSPWIISQHNGLPSNLNLDSTDSAVAGNGSDLYNGATTLETKGIEKLFRFSSLYSGEWERKNLKISIYDIKASSNEFDPYGSFSVMVRRSTDMDAAPVVVERFSSCNLNPASPDFVARKIGDMKSVWDSAERRYVNHGLYQNQSRFIRVELAPSVESGAADPRLLPFGFFGPPRRASLKMTTDATTAVASGVDAVDDAGDSHPTAAESDIHDIANDSGLNRAGNTTAAFVFAAGGDHGEDGKLSTGHPAEHGGISEDGKGWTLTLKFPAAALRTSSKDSTLSSSRDAYWGVSSLQSGSSSVFDASYADAVGFGAAGAALRAADPCALSDDEMYQFIFTLDDIKYAGKEDELSGVIIDPNRLKEKPRDFEWVPGSHARDYSVGGDKDAKGTDATACSITAYEGFTLQTTDHASLDTKLRERSYEAVLDAGCDRFTLPLVGGHDGLDITQIDPFGYHASMSNSGLPETGDSALDHYALNSAKKAIDAVSDPEVVEMNLLAMPGMVHPSLTSHAISVCESRGDALAIIDIDGDYMPSGLDNKSEAERMPNVTTAITKMRQRSLNSSYGCCFFPWTQISDSMSGRTLWAPPSIAALGTMASSTKKSELWFAPAGFTRGGLTDGAAGIGVNGVRLRLNSRERDKLYEANINPIAQFPSEGIVIFGQKTLQLTPSALDRINVRRLMIFLKKQVSRFAKTVLFDQNVQTTWTRFVSKVDPFLASVKARFGLTEYKIILDETTTTPELIDRNIMYAKILLKPAKAIEYIAIDFVITDSGASFDD